MHMPVRLCVRIVRIIVLYVAIKIMLYVKQKKNEQSSIFFIVMWHHLLITLFSKWNEECNWQRNITWSKKRVETASWLEGPVHCSLNCACERLSTSHVRTVQSFLKTWKKHHISIKEWNAGQSILKMTLIRKNTSVCQSEYRKVNALPFTKRKTGGKAMQ